MIEREGKWADRDYLVSMGVLPQRDAQQAILRSLPRITDAMVVAGKVAALLGDRVFSDTTAGEGNSLLFPRDAEERRFILSHPLLLLDADVPPLLPLPSPSRLDEPRLLPGPHRFPGKLRIAEGAANIEISYGDDGLRCMTSQTAGDTWTWGYHHEDRTFAIDPFAKPPQVPPIGLYGRADLDPAGHDLDAMAAMITELAPAPRDHGRVFVPVAMPGGVTGCWYRGLSRLREALWDGRIGDDVTAWAVIDAWTGTVAVVRPSLGEAFAAWKQAVARAQPLPPRDPPPADEPDDFPDEPPSSEIDEEKKTARFSTGTIRLVSVARVNIDWPETRPEHVPAIAVPLPPPLPFPAGWEGYGFTRRVRLVGEYGEVCTAFVRDEAEGCCTLIGEGAIAALDPTALDDALNRIDAERRREDDETWFADRPNPYTNPEYPWIIRSYAAWNDLGRSPDLRVCGIGWRGEIPVCGFDADQMRWTVTRVRRSNVAPMAANRGF